MKTKDELDELYDAIGDARRAFHKAVRETLKEGGCEYKLKGNFTDDSPLLLSYMGRHGLVELELDKVRSSTEKGAEEVIEVHVCYEDSDECDYWMYASDFGYDEDYIYASIIW